jgi:two-component system invasion response regulator UvrY
MINILIVDDHELVREGLKKVLKRQSDMNVVGEATNAHELFDQIERLPVDIVILDITLPGKSGLEVLKDLFSRHPKVRVLMLSMHPEERFAVRALKAGAAGYMTKDTATSELVGAIRKIMSGRKYTSAALAEQVVEIFSDQGGKPSHELLSDREFEVLCLLASGKTVSQIAEQLSLSVNTIATYRSRVLEKMKLKTNAELMRYALEHRLVD